MRKVWDWAAAGEQTCAYCKKSYPATPDHFKKNYSKPLGVSTICHGCIGLRDQPLPTGMKCCGICFEVQPIENFHAKSQKAKGNLVSPCRSCSAKRYAELSPEEKKTRTERNTQNARQRFRKVADGEVQPRKSMSQNERAVYLGDFPFGLRGIYQIRNLVNGKVYVGSAVNIRSRWLTHLRQLEHGQHHSPLLQRAWDKYGRENFKFEVLEVLTDQKLLLPIEQIWIDFLHAPARKGGYNASPFAGSPRDHKRTPEQRARLREATKHRKVPYIVIWPDGREQWVPSLDEFCNQEKQISPYAIKLAASQARLCKGFGCYRADQTREDWERRHAEFVRGVAAKKAIDQYRLFFPDGRYKDFVSLRAAAEHVGCSAGALGHILVGRYGKFTFRGMAIRRLDPSTQQVIGLPFVTKPKATPRNWREDASVTLKRCTKCGEEKPATSDFFCWHKSKGRYCPDCRKCQAAHSAEYRRENPEKVKEIKRRHQQKRNFQITSPNEQAAD